MPNTPKLLNKKQAAARLNLSTRRVLDFAKEGVLKTHKERTPSSRNQWETFFDAADVERLAHERRAPRTIDVGADIEKPKRERRPSPDPAAQASAMVAAVEAMRAVLPAAPPPAIPPPAPKLWLTLTDAAEYSGIPADVLRELIREGALAALDTHHRENKYLVRRKTLDEFDGGTVGEAEANMAQTANR